MEKSHKKRKKKIYHATFLMFFHLLNSFVLCELKPAAVTKHSRELTDDEVCNDNFLTSTYTYFPSNAPEYVCFKPLNISSVIYDTFLVLGDNPTIINSTHRVENSHGATGSRFKIILTNRMGQTIIYMIKNNDDRIHEMLNSEAYDGVNVEIETFYMMKKHWDGQLSTNITVDSNNTLTARLKSFVVLPFPTKSYNISAIPGDNAIDSDGDILNTSQTIVNRTELFYAFTIPKEIMELRESDKDVLDEGSYTAASTYSIVWEYSLSMSYPDKIIRRIDNSIYGPDTLDDYRLDGVYDPLDEICYYDYIDPFTNDSFYSFKYNEPLCFQAFNYKGNYYDTIFLLPSLNLFNGTNTTPAIGATGQRIKFTSFYDGNKNCTAFFFRTINSYVPEGVTANIDHYFVTKHSWEGEISLTYTVKNGNITAISGKVLSIFSDQPMRIIIEPSDGYVPIVEDYGKFYPENINYTDKTQVALTTKYNAYIIPKQIHNKVMNDGEYKASIKIETATPDHIINSGEEVVNKFKNHSIYGSSDTLDDVNLNGIDSTIVDDKEVMKMIIFGCAIFLVILFGLGCCLCSSGRGKKQSQVLDHSSDEEDTDVWIYEPKRSKRK